MIDERYHHGAVSMGNKMFVIGGNITCEVLGSVSGKFIYIKQMVRPETFSRTFSAVIIGCKVIVFPKHTSSVDKKCLIYDVPTIKWTLKEIVVIDTK